MIRAAVEGDLGVITLCRPEQRNALTPTMVSHLAGAVAELGRACGCLLIRGDGRVFCAGFDLGLCRESPDGSVMRALLRGLDEAVRAMRSSAAPVVVACRGAAIAGGCALLSGADFVVAEAGAKLGYPVVLLGVSPAVSAPTLAARIGSGAARARLLDPGLISGLEGQRLGLVSQVVATGEEVEGAARALAEVLASKPRGAMCATRAWLLRLEGQGTSAAWGLEASLSLTGGEEERRLLESSWAARGGREVPPQINPGRGAPGAGFGAGK